MPTPPSVDSTMEAILLVILSNIWGVRALYLVVTPVSMVVITSTKGSAETWYTVGKADSKPRDLMKTSRD